MKPAPRPVTAPEVLEARIAPAAGIVILNGVSGTGDLDAALLAGGDVTAAEVTAAAAGTLSSGALESLAAATNISVTSPGGIQFLLSATLALQTVAGSSASFVALAGNLTFQDGDDGLSTAGGGILLSTSGTLTPAVLTSGGGNIELVGNAIGIGAGVTINAGTGIATLRSFTAGTFIDLGGADAAGVLGLTDAELDLITAGRLQVGDVSAGHATVTADISPANTGRLEITTGGAIFNGGAQIIETRLALRAGMGVGTAATPLVINCANLEGRSDAGGIYINATGNPLGIGGVTGALSGLFAGSGGHVVVTSDSSLTIDEVVAAEGGGNVSLSATGGDLAVEALVLANGGNGHIELSASGDLTLTAFVQTLSGSGTGTGTISLRADSDSSGSGTFSSSNSIGITTDGGTISLTAPSATVGGSWESAGGAISFSTDTLDLTAAVTAGTGIVTLAGATASRPIELGGELLGGVLQISDLEIDQIIASVIRVGAASTGSVSVTGAISDLDGTLSLKAAGDLVQFAPVLVQHLALSTLGNIEFDGASNDFDTVAAMAGGIGVQHIKLLNVGSYQVGIVDGVEGVSLPNAAAGSQVTLTLGGSGIVTQATGNARVLAPKLALFGPGSFTLTNPANSVGTLLAQVTLGINYVNAGALRLGNAGDSAGVKTDAGLLAVRTVDGELRVANAISGNDVEAGGGGSVTLTAGSAAGQDRALVLEQGAGVRGEGGINLIGDAMDFSEASSANADGSTVTLRAATNGTLIDLGGADAANTLGLTSSDLNRITAEVLIIGSTLAGNVTVSAPVTAFPTQRIEVTTGGSIGALVGGTIGGAGLVLRASTGIGSAGTPLTLVVPALEATTTSGGIAITIDRNGAGIGGLTDALEGISAGGGDITIANTGGMFTSEPVTQTSGGNITLTALGANLSLEADVIATGGNGAINLSTTANLTIQERVAAAGTGAITITADSDNAGGDTLLVTSSAAIESVDGAITARVGATGTAESTLTLGGSITGSGAASGIIARSGGDLFMSASLTAGSGGITLRADTNSDGAGRIETNASQSIQATGSVTLSGVSVSSLASIEGGGIFIDTVAADEDGSIVVGGSLFVPAATGTISLTSDDDLTITATLSTLGTDTITLTADANNDSGGVLTLGLGSTLAVDLANGGIGILNDVFAVTGSITLAGALDISSVTAATDGDSFLILSNDGTDAISGIFTGLIEGSVISIGTSHYVISYVGGDGNDVELTAAVRTGTPSANGKTITFTDADGDTITVKTNIGTFSGDELVLIPGFGGNGATLAEMNFDAAFRGANITITAKRGPTGGNGFANVGWFNSAGVDLGAVTIAGDLGRMNAGAVKSLTVQSIGALGTSTQALGGSLQSTFSGKLGKLTVKSDVRDATIQGFSSIGPVKISGSFLGGQLSTAEDLGAITVRGDIVGTPAAPVVISAYGKAVAPVKGSDVAIKSLNVAGGVEYLTLLAGYGIGLIGTNADASIGAITVGADWRASTVLAGVGRGGDGLAGTNDDVALGGGGVRDNAAIVATIASLTIKGQAFGTAGVASDAFGVVAAQINKAKVGGVSFKFIKGPDTATTAPDVHALAPTGPGGSGLASDFYLREVVGI